MRNAIDIYANTNPSLCALVLQAFVDGYIQSAGKPCPLSLSFLAIPIVLSDRLSISFSSTNVTTGFFKWIARNPEITLGLAGVVEAAAQYSRAGLLFAIRYGVLTIDSAGLISLASARIQIPQANADLRSLRTLSHRFGIWIGNVPSEQAVFHNLGLRL
jgi:hypothetical protein